MLQKILVLLLIITNVYSQETDKPNRYTFGASYGTGQEFKNTDYTYTNKYVQLQFYYSLNPGKKWEYVFALQPEINFGTHQLLNLYFVTTEDPDYENKRVAFTKLKDTREYILNVALFLKRNITPDFWVYGMANVGPMLIDTETERMAKGFAFCDVVAFGTAYNFGSVLLDLRPNVRHVSNAGFKKPNSGYNTLNVAFCIIFPLK